MTDASITSPDDHRLAAELATGAGELLVALRAELASVDASADEVKAEGDRRANDYLMASLAEQAPQDAVLSEEAADDRRRLSARRVWVIDPLDGTREYSERGRTDWAVHVALTMDGWPVAGAVALPARGLTLATGTDLPHRPAPPHAPRMAVSRTRPPWFVTDMAERLGAELVPLGSAGVKTMAVVLGDADIYCHAGGQYEWDSAAPVAVALAAGLHATRLDVSPLRYNSPSPYLPDLLICHPSLAAAAQRAAEEAAAVVEGPGGRATPTT